MKRSAHEAEHGYRGVTNAEIAVALYDTSGHVAQAARKLGVSHITVYRKIRTSRELRTLRAEIERQIARGVFGELTLIQTMKAAGRA